MFSQIVIVSLVGGLIALDRTAAFQIMVSRPLVAAPLVGLILGQPIVGLMLGSLTELIWLNRLPVGGDIAINDSYASIIVTAAIIMTESRLGEAGRELIVLGVLIMIPLGWLGIWWERALRLAGGVIMDKATHKISTHQTEKAAGYNLAGLLMAFIAGVVFIAFFLPLITLFLTWFFPILNLAALKTLKLMFLLTPLVGVAAVLSSAHVKKSVLFFAACFLVSFTFLQFS